MKKIMTSVAFLALASMVQAASLNWNITSVLDPDTGNKASGYAAYLFITEQSSNFGSNTTTLTDVETLIKTAGTQVVTDGEGKVTGIKNGTTTIDVAGTGATGASGGISGATGYNGNNFGAGDSLTAFAVIFDAADFANAKNYIVTSPKSAAWTSSTGSKMLGFGNQANNTWTPIPEPSTAALALAGLALLLKRRRA